jgi:ferredoxin-NADP reductase
MNTNNSTWLEATVVNTFNVASNVKGLVFDVPGWLGHKAGQHVDVRLTAPDGYMAERSYSIANAPGQGNLVELGVELMANGEVSPYLWQLKAGDKIELRGPIGGHFVWESSMKEPLILVGGGSGMVPLMSMIRHAVAMDSMAEREVVFIISLRTIDKLLYAGELREIEAKYPHIKVIVTVTESASEDWKGYTRRIDTEMFTEVLADFKGKTVAAYICGPTKFVEVAAGLLTATGFSTEVIKTERFGG